MWLITTSGGAQAAAPPPSGSTTNSPQPPTPTPEPVLPATGANTDPSRAPISAPITMPSPDSDAGLKGLYPPPSTPLTPAGDYVPIPVPDESMDLELPTVKQLLPVGGKLPAIRLEASYTQPVSLRDVLRYCLDYNLPIRISKEQVTNQKWLLASAAGGFLPNILMSYRQQILSGASLVQGVIPVQFHTPNANAVVNFQQYLFQGGRVMFGNLVALNNFRASKFQLRGTINDTLLAIARGYYDLLLNQGLLQTRVQAVENSRAQLALNQKLEAGGVGTRFNVMQSETQLASDEQNLLAQEVTLRQSAINLATAMNLNQTVNLLPLERTVKKVRLIDPSLNVNDLIRLAILYRPELKQFNYLRLAAQRNVQVQAAPLYPSFYMFATITGNGATLTRQKAIQSGSLQTIPVTGPSPGAPLRFGGAASGNPNSFAVDDSSLGFGGPSGAALLNNPLPVGEIFIPAQAVSRQMRKSTALGFQLDWNYNGLGVPALANVQAARANARIAMLQSNQTLMNVLQQVRSAYLNSEIAERQIDVASKAVVSSGEQLRLAEVRLANGVGTNIDVIQAQNVWTQARINKVTAIIQFNVAQAQLVHDIGLITLDTLTSGRLLRE